MEGQAAQRQPLRFTIFYQILLAMCVVSTIPIAGLWYISVHESRQVWDSIVSHDLNQSAETLGRSVEEWTSMNLRLLDQNAKVPAIRSMDDSLQDPVLKSISDTYDWIYLAFTVSPDGKNVGRSDGKPQTFYGDRAYFKQIMGGAAVGQQVALGKTSKKPAFMLARPILSDASETQGVIAIAMTLEDLSNTITKTRIGKTGYAILLDENDRLIAHGGGGVTSELQDFGNHPAAHLQSRPGDPPFVFELDGRRFVAVTRVLDHGWKFIVMQDALEAYEAADRARLYSLILLASTLVGVILVALLLARRFSAPIRRLTAAADEISRGGFETEIGETDRADEIGALARAIERMRVSLAMALNRLRNR
ncbi:cache domain-containing protein [Imhoffiella purpurea]|uniref:histidine kinase n=1 Tax=Imhoffiella purpurea TaxID=1249627 RepID=W9VJB0_9GAMM|nr:cache and HAMP domain-containing protein [Imhoffiella purpurea]EXJ16147.1 Methyl-accepting chemotaxis protein I (serine chemoreceptor protein) [Imhoffiella purpurea]